LALRASAKVSTISQPSRRAIASISDTCASIESTCRSSLSDDLRAYKKYRFRLIRNPDSTPFSLKRNDRLYQIDEALCFLQSLCVA
jgi:hypothetical protein